MGAALEGSNSPHSLSSTQLHGGARTGNGAFRGLRDTRTPLVILVGCNAANLVLDPLLIFGGGGLPAFGTGGAAAATVVGEWGAAAAFLWQLQQRGLLDFPSALPQWEQVRERERECGNNGDSCCTPSTLPQERERAERGEFSVAA